MSLAVFYRPEQNARTSSYSPSAGKPAAVVADWQERGLDIEVHRFDPVTPADLMLAHAPAYVQGVLAGRLPTGFGDADCAVAASCLYTVGSLLAAARAVCGTSRIACSPTSGFHHAGWADGGSYCTFNGLVVAARKLIDEGRAQRVAILDLDQHYGDGTAEILRLQGRSDIAHYTGGEHYRSLHQARGFLRDLPGIVRELCAGADVLLYQAGADPHIDDPLGGWLSSTQLRERDAIVFETALALGVPVAWNLAGGYQRDANGGIAPVLAIHRATMEVALRVDALAAAADAIAV